MIWDTEFFNRENKETAYWAGFMMGDGWIIKRGNTYRFGLGLCIQELIHLEKFCQAIKLDKKYIKIKNNKCRNKTHQLCYIELTDKNLLNHLSKWGVILNKTHNYLEPNIKDELLGDYIRGWFDADGCANLKGKKTKQVILCGHPEAMKYFENSMRLLGYSQGICKQNRNKISVYVLSGLKSINQFYNICNGNCLPKLERKWKLISNYLKEV